MSETTLNARLQHASIGNGSTNINSIPKQGEIIFNSTLDNFRVGDGSNTYSNLSNFLPSAFTGASTSSAGTLGFVPAPAQKASGEADKFLCDDGSWKLVSGSGGTDTHYHTSLNNVDYGDTSGVNLGSWYAPTSSGTSANQLLLSQGTNNAPAWTTFSFPSTGTDKILSYVGGTGWSLINTYSVVTDGSGSIGLLKRDTDTTVSSQTQSTKFLREDGTWAAPSYTTNTDTKVQQVGNHTSNWEYNILLKTNANNNEETNYVRFCDATNRPTVNCSTGLLTAPGYILSSSGKKILVGDGTSIAPDSVIDANKFLKWTGSTFTWDTGGGTNVSANNITLTTAAQNYISIDNTNYTIAMPSSDPYSSARTPEAHNHGYLKNDGTTVMAYNNQGNDTYPNDGVPVETGDKIIIADRNNSGGDNKLVRSAITFGNSTTTFLRNDGQWVTPTGGSYTAASTASGADNPGLLKVAADSDPNTGYKNTNFKIAVPIFYGNIKNLKVYNSEKETYDDGNSFTCHYVNIYDIINGLISDNTLVGILKDAIEKWEPPK